MQKNTLTFDQLPDVVYQLCNDINELKQLLANQPSATHCVNDDKPLSVDDAAEYLGISKQTVYQNIEKIPHKKRFGRLYFFRAKLSEYLNDGKGKNA